MANYCQYCGKILRDGEICSCPQAQAEAARMYQGQQFSQEHQQPPQGYRPPPQGYWQPAGSGSAGSAFQKIIPYVKSYIKAPVSTAQGLIARKDMAFAAVMLCIQAIAGGLLLFSFVSAYLKNLGAALFAPMLASFKLLSGGKVISQIADLTGELIEYFDLDGLNVKFSANFPMSLLFGILATAAAVAVFVLIAFAVCKIAGSNCSIRDVVIASAAHTPIVTALLLLSFLFFLFFMPLGIIFLVLATVSWMILAIPTFLALAPSAAQDKFWVCAIVGILAALLIGGWAAHSIGSAAVAQAKVKIERKTYTVDELREDAEDALDDLEDALDNIKDALDDIDFDDLMYIINYLF